MTRSETITVRLDPRLHYLATLAARAMRMSTSSFVEWAAKRGVEAQLLRTGQQLVALDLWDEGPDERMLRLREGAPELLTHQEQVAMKRAQQEAIIERNRARKDHQR